VGSFGGETNLYKYKNNFDKTHPLLPTYMYHSFWLFTCNVLRPYSYGIILLQMYMHSINIESIATEDW
jgi:hypothetical protein